jgi:predicted nuclease of predicted toxin-antitoxin system
MLKFIIDTQLPPKLAKYLRDKGFPTVHTTYFPNGHLLDDSAIIEIAIRDNRIIITKDSDFLDNFLLNGVPPKVLMLQFGNISNSELQALFDRDINQIVHTFSDEGADFITFNRAYISVY